MSGLDGLIGTTYGPFPVPVSADRVEAFVAATGDDPQRWHDMVPPMFASVALFGAAPAFLEDEAVLPFTRSLIHSEQSYSWSRPLDIGETLQVFGTVEAVRVRGSLSLVTFSLAAGSDSNPWITGSSVFLLSTDAAAGADEWEEPDEDDRPPFDTAGAPLQLPGDGDPLAEMRCGASRSDLVRYAAASEDWNPIHLDHDAARSAGLGGVIVHGLLMASWIGSLASRYGLLTAMRLRFRNPLRPSASAVVTGSVASIVDDTADIDLVLSAGQHRLVTARASVTT